MSYCVFDIETNGLRDNVTKIHCMSVYEINGEINTKYTFIEYQEMIEFFEHNPDKILVGHKIITYDIPVLEKILGIKICNRVVDTLGLSWYLYPKMFEHGLEVWGEQFGIPKPKVVDWNNEPIMTYIHRCQEDVKINVKLFLMQMEYLRRIYSSENEVQRLIGYIMYKLSCAREQEEVKWRLDRKKAQESLVKLDIIKAEKIALLSELMPHTFEYRKVARPKNMYKKDGSISSRGEKWLELLKSMNLPEYHNGTLKIPTKEHKGNPSSHQQLKEWLFTLGWIPVTFKYEKEEDGTQRKIPQLSTDEGICESIVKLYEVEPKLKEIEGLFMISHRANILKGFLRDCDSEGFLKAEIQGLANTLRFKHTTIVNLPTIHKPYGDIVRGCLIAPDDDHILCGADVSGLEESTKHHYMYPYDPKYVDEMRQPGFDPHLDIAVLSGKITQEQADAHKAKKEDHTKVRWLAKRTNFGATYGVGALKLSLTSDMTVKEAKQMLIIYWKRNKAIKIVAERTPHKTVDGQMWLWNPVSEFWYSLRYEKDKFSTLNQSTGCYAFDTWVRRVRSKGIKICGQFHDEIIFPLLNSEESRNRCTFILQEAMKEANEELGLNVTLSISIDYGRNYAEIH